MLKNISKYEFKEIVIKQSKINVILIPEISTRSSSNEKRKIRHKKINHTKLHYKSNLSVGFVRCAFLYGKSDEENTVVMIK